MSSHISDRSVRTGKRRTPEKAQKMSPYAAWELSYANERILEGLPYSAVEALQKKLSISRAALAGLLTMSPRTLARRESEKHLAPDESERLYRVGRLLDLAEFILNGPRHAVDWMKAENISLGGAAPLGFIKTEPGARLVEQILGRIEYGIPV